MKQILFLTLCLALVGSSCNRNAQNQAGKLENTTTAGVVTICVDETLKPIIQEEIEVFEGLYPKANIIPRYTSEVTAFNDLFADSVKLIVVTRPLSDEEIQSLQANSLYPKMSKVAIDGVALISNRSNPDSLVTMEQLHDIFTGKITRWKQLNAQSRLGDIEVVFDNTYSSTVRYIVEQVCKGDSLVGNITAAQNNESVIDYVSKVPNAMGVIGSNWIDNKNDSTHLSFNEEIQVMLISVDPIAFNGNSYQPFQAYLAMQLYPLSREIYMICTANRNSLPFGFTSFVSSDKGQRIILKSGILPAKQPLRVVNIRENL